MARLDAGSPVGSWDDFRFLLAVARAGSMNAAAKTLGVDHTTVSRRLRSLEGDLGAKLLVRRDNALVPTPEGQIAVAEAERLEEISASLVRRLQDADARLSGEIRLGMTEGLASYWLVPRLQPFREEHPGIAVNMVFSNQIQDLTRDVDVAVRYVAPQDPSLVVRRVARMKFALFSNARYAERNGSIASFDDLPSHCFIDQSAYEANPALRPWQAQIKALPVAMRADSSVAVFQAIRSGAGVCLLPEYTSLIEDGLVRMPLDLGLSTDVFLVYSEERRHIARLRALTAELARLFERDRGAWFAA